MNVSKSFIMERGIISRCSSILHNLKCFSLKHYKFMCSRRQCVWVCLCVRVCVLFSRFISFDEIKSKRCIPFEHKRWHFTNDCTMDFMRSILMRRLTVSQRYDGGCASDQKWYEKSNAMKAAVLSACTLAAIINDIGSITNGAVNGGTVKQMSLNNHECHGRERDAHRRVHAERFTRAMCIYRLLSIWCWRMAAS